MTQPPPDSETPVPAQPTLHVASVVHARKNTDLTLRYLAIGLLVLVILIPTFILISIETRGSLTENKTVVIPHGTNLHEIAALLNSHEVISSPLVFRLAAKIIAYDSLKAGEYQFTPEQSLADIVLMMHEGRSVVHLFTVAEGLTSAEIIHMLNTTPALRGELNSLPPEGSLLPETYRYNFSDSRTGITTRMQKAMHETLTELWNKRDKTVPLNAPEEAVIMASIIEKETGKPEERPRIAGVFYNRLRLHMRLQSDPTVIYAILQAKETGGKETGMDHSLTHADLSYPSPINTYANDGLPPQPICNPGRAALEAALHPEQNEFLYFVADGTGGHAFARNLEEHNQNVTRWNGLKDK